MLAITGFLIFAAVFCYYMSKWSQELQETERVERLERIENATRRPTGQVIVANFGTQATERRAA